MKQTFVKAAVMACFMAAVSDADRHRRQWVPAEYAVMTIATTDREIPINYSATIRGRQDIAIYPQVSGTIFATLRKRGSDRFERPAPFHHRSGAVQSGACRPQKPTWQAAKAGVATAQLTYDSKKELYAKQRGFAVRPARRPNNTLLTAKAQLAQAEAQRVNAANNLSYTVVKAPANGVVGTLPYRVGALVSASISKPLTTVSDNSDDIRLLLDDREPAAQPDPSVRFDRRTRSRTCPTYGWCSTTVRSMTGRAASSRSAASSTPRRAAYQLRAVFPNADGLLHSGGAGSVIVPNIHKDCVVVPQVATFELQNKVYVYKVEDGKAASSMIDVEKIYERPRVYRHVAGLTPGDVIVAEGVGLLREGTPIVAEGTGRSAAAAAPASDESAAQTQTEKEE